MNLTFDPSVTAGEQSLINAALAASLFPFQFVNMNVLVKTPPFASHSGKYEGATSILQPATYQSFGSAVVQFSQGLFNPGSPLWFGLPFVYETVLHEFGHVVTLGMGAQDDWTAFCQMFGIDFGTQWEPPGATSGGQPWLHAGIEATAETFKDLFARPANRHFLNRTDFKLPAWAQPYFIAQCAKKLPWSVQPITALTSMGSVTVGGHPVESRYTIITPTPGALEAGVQVNLLGQALPAAGMGVSVLTNPNLGSWINAFGGGAAGNLHEVLFNINFNVPVGAGDIYAVVFSLQTDLGSWPPYPFANVVSIPPLPIVQAWPYAVGATGTSGLASSRGQQGVL